MKISDFLNLLRQTPRNWGLLNVSDQIRTNGKLMSDGGKCPLMVVSDVSSDSGIQCGKELGLTSIVCCKIMQAADGRPGPLRAQLLEACGLKELT